MSVSSSKSGEFYLVCHLNQVQIAISIEIFFLGMENGFDAEEYQNNDSEED